MEEVKKEEMKAPVVLMMKQGCSKKLKNSKGQKPKPTKLRRGVELKKRREGSSNKRTKSNNVLSTSSVNKRCSDSSRWNKKNRNINNSSRDSSLETMTLVKRKKKTTEATWIWTPQASKEEEVLL